MTEHVRQATKRRAISGAALSVLLYAAPIWDCAIKHAKYKNMVASVQRKLALRISSAYRTVSLEAAQVLAGLIPIDLKIKERRQTHGNNNTGTREQIRQDIMKEWQDRWNGMQQKAKWTRTLIKDIQFWMDRRHGEVNYHMSQFLTGHGSFGKYLKRIRKVEEATCRYCGEEDTARHTFYECGKWEEERGRVNAKMKGDFTPEKTIERIIERQEIWEAVNSFVVEVIKEKEEDERRLPAANG